MHGGSGGAAAGGMQGRGGGGSILDATGHPHVRAVSASLASETSRHRRDRSSMRSPSLMMRGGGSGAGGGGGGGGVAPGPLLDGASRGDRYYDHHSLDSVLPKLAAVQLAQSLESVREQASLLEWRLQNSQDQVDQQVGRGAQ